VTPLRTALCALAMSACAAGAAGARELTPADFEMRAALTTERADGLHVVQIGESVLRAATTPQPYDLRIFNGAGEALPTAPLPGVVPAEPTRLPPAALNIAALPRAPEARERVLADFALRFERDREHTLLEVGPAVAPAPERPAALAGAAGPAGAAGGYLIDLRSLKGKQGDLMLHFAADAPDYASQVTISGSDDLVSWRPLVMGPLTRNRQLGEQVERSAFPLNDPPAFGRVLWPSAESPRLDSVLFAQRLAAVRVPLPRAALALVRGQAGQWLVDIPVGLPVARFVIHAPQPNQALRVELRCLYPGELAPARRHRLRGLSARSESDPWTICARDVEVIRADRGGEWIENPPIAIPGRPSQMELRVTDPKDYEGAPPVVEVEWVPVRLAFLARAPGPYVLAIGREGTDPGPRLDLPSVMLRNDPYGAAFPLAHLVQDAGGGQADAAQAASGAQNAVRAQARWRWMLWAVLVAAVLALAAMAWQLARRIGRSDAA